MNKRNILIYTIIAIIITIIFFTYSPIITFDTSHYLWLTDLLTPNGDFSNWDNVRGLSFPLIILISQILMGKSPKALLIVMYIFYLLMLWICIKIFKEIKIESKIFKVIFCILFLFMILVNPLILGYYHVLLTEFVGMTIAIVSCYMSWKFIQINFKENKKAYILYTLSFILLSIFMWHIKQPYISTVIFPLIVACVISILKNLKLNNIIQRVITILLCIISVIFSLLIWNKIMISNNVKIVENRTSSNMISNQLLKGISFYQAKNDKITEEYIKKNNYLSENEKVKVIELIKNNSEKFVILEEKKEDKVIDTEVIFIENENITTFESIGFIFKTLFKNPKILFKSYFLGYLAVGDIYGVEFNEAQHYSVTELLKIFELYENDAIGYRMYKYELSNTFPLAENYNIYAESYKEDILPILFINWVMQKLQYISIIIYKSSFIIAPILLIINIVWSIYRCKKNNNCNNILYLSIILLSFSFLHILMHVVLGAIIDRYTMPAAIPMYLAIILELYLIFNDINNKKGKANEKV